jgi:hypothetical protein
MNYGQIPFSQWEADIAVYLSDASGNTVGGASPIWLGGTPSKSNFSDGFKEEEANISGQPGVNIQHLEETHGIELENVWMARADQPVGGVVPVEVLGLDRNQFYSIAIIWTDEETGVWVKRVYYGVKLPELSMSTENQVMAQKMKFEGGTMLQTAGTPQQAPDEGVALYGRVQYVNTLGQATDIYTYDFGTRVFSPVGGGVPGNSVGWDGTENEITVAGMVALIVTEAGQVQVEQLSAGGTYNNPPRLDFYAGASRIASVSAAGVLAVTSFRETDVDPGLPLGFALVDSEGHWLATIDATGVYAPSITDDL